MLMMTKGLLSVLIKFTWVIHSVAVKYQLLYDQKKRWDNFGWYIVLYENRGEEVSSRPCS